MDRRTLIRLAGAAPLAAGVPLAYAQGTDLMVASW
jgi:hypothetical protein